ncbi:hypothetical protein GH714_012040 [Hevea brasiliensis]|uniref:ADP-ribosylation factor n=1 Tax=Hevea brasiliensis TaxID=3981 RepID=A0A6A6K4V5_HEVBR|nr:hypothetical protein GH714_012040 [Hevea brasiliensis]
MSEEAYVIRNLFGEFWRRKIFDKACEFAVLVAFPWNFKAKQRNEGNGGADEVGGELKRRLSNIVLAIGFNVETVQYNNIKFQVWDLGGQTSIRPYWRCYFPNTQAVIYVVDSSDTDRIGIAKEEFHAILEDLPGALDDASVTEALELHKIKNRQWAIFKTCAVKGEGLFEGLDWLTNTLKSGGG